jgi:hypothetical protein
LVRDGQWVGTIVISAVRKDILRLVLSDPEQAAEFVRIGAEILKRLSLHRGDPGARIRKFEDCAIDIAE